MFVSSLRCERMRVFLDQVRPECKLFQYPWIFSVPMPAWLPRQWNALRLWVRYGSVHFHDDDIWLEWPPEFISSFLCQSPKRSNNPNLHKETKNNKLKDSGGWRKMTPSCGFLNVFVGSFVTFYPWCNAHIVVWYFPFAADDTCDGVICDQNSACVPIALGGRDRQCVCLDGWTGDGRSCTGKK